MIIPRSGAIMRIAIATPARNSYSETFIAAHIRGLQRVELLLHDGALPLRTGDDRPIVRTEGLDGLRDRFLSLFSLGLNGLLRKRITNLLRRHRIDVVLAEYADAGQELLESCERAGVPLVVHFHGYDAYRPYHIERYGNYRRIFDRAARLVVVSHHMEQQLVTLGAAPDRVVYNCYGIDLDRFHVGDPSKAPPHLLAVGRFVPKKDPLTTLRAFHIAWQQRPEARLTMIGNGPLWEDARSLVRELGMDAVVELPGIRSPDDVAAAMRSCRAFVQHSVISSGNDHEGTPVAILEAMASGLPIIATCHAGIPEVVEHGVRGLLGAEHDMDTMAAHMIQLIDDPGMALTMGRAGRAYMEQNHRMEDRIAALQGILADATVAH